jgi:hypothetical protein
LPAAVETVVARDVPAAVNIDIVGVAPESCSTGADTGRSSGIPIARDAVDYRQIGVSVAALELPNILVGG